MTRDEYIAWKATRGDDPATWNRDTCYAADALIRKTAIDAFTAWARTGIPNVTVRDFVCDMVQAHFGSVEVDMMLTELRLYPDWI